MGTRTTEERELLLQAFRAGLAATDPAVVVPPALPQPSTGRTVVLGAGKAGAVMARSVEENWDGPLSGMVVVPYGHAVECDHIEVLEAAHPVPDSAGEEAARRMLRLAQGLTKDDLLIALFSGGGSALLPLPAPPLTMGDKQSITEQLLRVGAPIGDINCVRKHLSSIKGGHLASVAAPARLVTILISDVAGDDVSLIASGPTVADVSTLDDARRVIDTYGLQVSTTIREHLARPANETPKPGDPCFDQATATVVASSRICLDAAAAALRSAGMAPFVLSDSVQGESRDVAKSQAALVQDIQHFGRPFPSPCVLLSGGETTVTVRGGGRGGPNMEFLLSLLTELGDTTGVAALACDTDGCDGSTTSAGALLLPDTALRAARVGLDPSRFLADNDSLHFFAALGDLVDTGPTLTNVNDFRAIFVSAPPHGDGYNMAD